MFTHPTSPSGSVQEFERLGNLLIQAMPFFQDFASVTEIIDGYVAYLEGKEYRQLVFNDKKDFFYFARNPQSYQITSHQTATVQCSCVFLWDNRNASPDGTDLTEYVIGTALRFLPVGSDFTVFANSEDAVQGLGEGVFKFPRRTVRIDFQIDINLPCPSPIWAAGC